MCWLYRLLELDFPRNPGVAWEGGAVDLPVGQGVLEVPTKRQVLKRLTNYAEVSESPAKFAVVGCQVLSAACACPWLTLGMFVQDVSGSPIALLLL